MNDVFIMYRYEGDQRQFWHINEGWTLSEASFLDEEEAQEFILENPEAAFITI